MIILPNDATIVSYKKDPKNKHQFNPVYKSEKWQFTGTEENFLAKGFAYHAPEVPFHKRHRLYTAA